MITYKLKQFQFMRHPYIVKSAFLMALALAATTANAKSDIPLRKIRAVKPANQVNMLDSVVGDSYRKIYKYNEYGYITSVMTYRKDSKWTIDTSDSYVQDYVFEADGRCTSRIRYNVDGQGNRGTVESKGEITVKDGLTWEYTYERFEDGNLHPVTAKAYDKWGNLSVEIAYETDWSSFEDYISTYNEKRYSASTHPGHYRQSSFESAYRTYSVEAKSGKRTMNPDSLNLSYGQTIKWETIDGKLHCKYYATRYLDSNAKLADLDKNLSLEREDVYELNADGTRPVSMTSTYSPGESYESSSYYTYTWDDKGRLLGESYGATESSVSWKRAYTYADDYVKEMSLMDAVNALSHNLKEYPEDEYCQFGHLATHTVENYGSNYSNTDETSYTWDDNGHLVSAKWIESGTESWYDYGSEEPTTKEYSDTGEEYFHYNSDGHMSYMIGKEIEDDGDCEYYKMEYVYERGIWTDVNEYSGDSIDGPWTSDNGSKKVRARKSARKSAAFTEDMSDGWHDIYNEDGVFITKGYYEVAEGKIVAGYYQQYINSSAATPKNPELNYTNPEVPMDITDEWDAVASLATWSYVWDTESEAWKLQFGPEVAEHIYRSGNDIICDTYNREQQKTGTTTFSLDDDERLVKQSSEDFEITYEYVDDDSNYLLETVTTTGGKRSVQHYYYSLHDYTPTAIENVTTTVAKDDACYDMQGRRVVTPSAHGIYIVNGKKVVK